MTTPSSKTTQELKAVDQDAYRKASAATLASIHEVVSTAELTHFSNRSITEVEALQEEISAVIPAGNIVGLVLGGLIRLRGRTLPADQAKSDVSALLRGIEMLPRRILPSTLYGTFFVGPAAVLAAYQKLLALAGKDPNSAFPDGLWQFYLEFALREDSARHANETIGFQKALENYGLHLSNMDQLAAWVCAVSQIYFQYDDLLYNEWRERVCLNLMQQAVARANLSHKLSFQRLPQAWAAQRPYSRGQDAGHSENYSYYRRRRFDSFWQSRLEFLPSQQKNEIEEAYAGRVEQELAAYQRQMTILTSLDPDRYRENRLALSLWQARIGIIVQGCYYLLPACHTDQAGRPILFETEEPTSPFHALQLDSQGHLCDPRGQVLRVDRIGRVYDADTDRLLGYLRPAHFQAVRRQVAAILARHSRTQAGELPSAELDRQLLAIPRSEQERARKELSSESQQELQALKCAPVIINWNEQDATKPLVYIRQSQRGVGDQALTIFHTPESMVFDQSHIFFDGTWGMALAEILTGEAVSWAAYFSSLTVPEPSGTPPYHLNLAGSANLDRFPQVTAAEVSAEDTGIDTSSLYALRKLLPKRHPDLKLTVNDLLILYRCEFGHEYHPSSELEDALFELKAQDTPAALDAYALINNILAESQANNPSIMIPMDATAISPRERLYPNTFRNPFTEFWSHYHKAAEALARYEAAQDQAHWAAFTEARRSLLAQFNYFGQLLRAYKRVALEGGSTTTATIKLMAHLPDSLLKLLDEIPRRIDVLNEVIKGQEVFSNVGRVARGSSLTRFISAKDDNENKTLVWGILTDDTDVMHVSLRDFRPHVATLKAMNQTDLSEMIVKDYLSGFSAGFNQFVRRILDILNATASHNLTEVAE